MACHYLDLAHWALDLGVPHRIRAHGPEPDDIATPRWMIVDWVHPAIKGRGTVKAHWYDGGKRPSLLKEIGMSQWRNGVLFVGNRGWLLADYGRYVLGPKPKFKGFKAPPHSIPNSRGHHREWIEACKGRGTTTCSFDYSGPLTETVLLGAVAYRLGREIQFDIEKAQCPKDTEANGLIAPAHRKGFEV
jgi:predicted dehydrogenase